VNFLLKINDVEFSLEESEFLCKYIIEDACQFHSAVFNDFGEFAKDLTNELYDGEQPSEFIKNKETFKKLNQLGINTYGLEK
jgi:hypothetical protein